MDKFSLPQQKKNKLFELLRNRFDKKSDRHQGLSWDDIQNKLEKSENKIWSLNQMEETGGEPDVIGYDKKSDEYLFFDCSVESPSGRRSLCYDNDALNKRKSAKPRNSALGLAAEMGVDVLNEEQYYELQKLGNFDTKTSSWIYTPSEIRLLGGAIFGDYRFGKVFIYHNGVESYYGGRGFRGLLRV